MRIPAVIFAVAIQCIVLAFIAQNTAPTTDEPSHLASGLYFWRSGSSDVYPVNPPLVKSIAAVPILFLTPEEDWSRVVPLPVRSEMNVGTDFIAANDSQIFRMMALARWTCIPFCILGGIVCFVWAEQLFGAPCGWISLLLWSFSPSILANGALITSDVAGASFGVLAGFAFWHWLRNPTWKQAILTGGALGLCLLTKLTWVILPFVWITIWTVHWWNERPRKCRFDVGTCHIACSTFIAILVLNTGYGFQGTLQPLGSFQFTSQILSGKPVRPDYPIPGNRFRDTFLGILPVPFPSPFVYGLDAQKQDFEESRVLYFGHQRSHSGWSHFYFQAFLLKEPIGTIVLLAWLILSFLGSQGRCATACKLLSVWVPPLFLLGLVTTHPRLNYYRYLIPAFPFLFVALSSVAKTKQSRLHTLVLSTCMASTVLSGLSTIPHSLSYVNFLGGGAANGHWWFADCNFDWGQDLFALRRWINDHPDVVQIHVGYFGSVPQDVAGVSSAEMEAALLNPALRGDSFRIPAGWYAISASHVHGIEGVVYSSTGQIRTVFDAGLTLFEREKAIDRAGPSILIYHIVDPDGNGQVED